MDTLDIASIDLNRPVPDRRKARSQAMETFIYMHLRRKARKKKLMSTQQQKHGGQNNNSHRRDQDLPDINKMQWTENSNGVGTIPGHLSMRAPPANIGISGKREKLLGITNHEVSERYILKLQRDRERNNQAVFKSLENLPITIRHVPKQRNNSEPILYSNRLPGTEARPSSMRTISPDGVSYRRLLDTSNTCLNVVGIDGSSIVKGESPIVKAPVVKSSSEFKKMKAAGPMCPHLMSFTACKKCARLKRRRKRPDIKKDTPPALGSDIDINLHPDLNSNNQDKSDTSTENGANDKVNKIGFQGHQVRSKYARVAPRRKKPAFGLSVSSDSTFQKKYTKIVDSNQEVHFVNTSVISGQRVGALGKTFKKLPRIPLTRPYCARESTEVFAIKSVQLYNEPSPQPVFDTDQTIDGISPAPVPAAPMHSFASELSADITYPTTSDELSTQNTLDHANNLHIPHEEIVDSNIGQFSNNVETKVKFFNDSKNRIDSNEIQHQLPNRKSYTKSNRKDDERKDKVSFKDNMSNRSHYSSVGPQSRSKHFNKTVTSDMQFSVRIEYKQTDDHISTKENTYSEMVTVPRWVEEDKSKVESTGQNKDVQREYELTTVDNEGYSDISADKDTINLSNKQENQYYGKENQGHKDTVNLHKFTTSDGHAASEIVKMCKQTSETQIKCDEKEIPQIHCNTDNEVRTESKVEVQIKHKEKGYENISKGHRENESVQGAHKESWENGLKRASSANVNGSYTENNDISSNVGVSGILKNPNESELLHKSPTDSGFVSTSVGSDEQNACHSVSDVDNTITGVTDKASEEESQNDCFDDEDEEIGGGFFVTTLDSIDANEHLTEKITEGLSPGSDSGIEHEELDTLPEYTNNDTRIDTKIPNPRIGIGMSHDIQA